MINLEEYGFVKTSTTDRWEEYEGRDFTVTIYNYFVKNFAGVEITSHTFMVSSKQFTSRSRQVSELSDWLMEKKITKA